jgi:hypothetical protein
MAEDVARQILNPGGDSANVELLDRTIDSFYSAVSNEQVRFWTLWCLNILLACRGCFLLYLNEWFVSL